MPETSQRKRDRPTPDRGHEHWSSRVVGMRASLYADGQGALCDLWNCPVISCHTPGVQGGSRMLRRAHIDASGST